MGKVLMSGGGGGVGSDEVTATKDKVLSGQTYLGADTDDEVGTGTIPIRTPVNLSLGINGTTALPYGYYPSESKITQKIATRGAATITPGKTAQTIGAGQYLSGAQTIASLGGNAPASMVHPSYTFSSDNAGRAQKGTMATMGGQTVTPGNFAQTVWCSGNYMSGNVTVPAVSNLNAAYIRKGVTVGGVTGTFEGYVTNPVYLFNNGNWSNIQTTGWNGGGSDVAGGRYFDEHSGIAVGTSFSAYTICSLRQIFDLTNYKYIKINIANFKGRDIEPTATGRGFIGVSKSYSVTTPSSSTMALYIPWENSSTGVCILDISSLTGNYYIYTGMSYRVSSSKHYYYSTRITQLFLTNT